MNGRVVLGLMTVFALSACENDNSLRNIPLSNNGPVAVIESAATSFAPLDVTSFDGSASHDEDGSISDFQWTVIERPLGADPTNEFVEINGGRQAEFFVDLAGDYKIRLQVIDNDGGSDIEEFEFSAVPWQAVHVQLSWNKPRADIDLHLVSDTNMGSFYSSPYDCYFGNPNPNWGSFNSEADDPHLDIDDVEGYGPENINLDLPSANTSYHVYVHSYDDDGDGTVQARVRIYLSGELKWEGTQNLTTTGKVWNVGTIAWPTGSIQPNGTIFQHGSLIASPK